MKRIFSFLFAAALLMSLSSCKLTYEDATEKVSYLLSAEFSSRTGEKIIEKYGENEVFQQAIIDGFTVETMGRNLVLINHLNALNYKNENIKAAFQSYIEEILSAIQSGSLTLMEYYIRVLKYMENNYYANIAECLPYQKIVSYITSHYVEAVFSYGHGGYYDNEEFKNVSYWYDPLGERYLASGSIGTYHYSDSYVRKGDFMVENEETYWYKTDSNDSCNSSYIHIYFRGEELDSRSKEGTYEGRKGESIINDFVQRLNYHTSVYYDESRLFPIFLITPDSITKVERHELSELITIQYS